MKRRVYEFSIAVTDRQDWDTHNGVKDDWIYFTSSTDIDERFYVHACNFRRGELRFKMYYHKHIDKTPDMGTLKRLAGMIHDYIETGRATVDRFWF